jgi:hypothetical protein
MTGRRAGYCAGYGVPGYATPAFGRMGPQRGRGWGGGGRGWRHMYYATGIPGWARFGYGPAWGVPPAYSPYARAMDEEQEMQMLRGQAEALKQQLDAISQRLSELESES